MKVSLQEKPLQNKVSNKENLAKKIDEKRKLSMKKTKETKKMKPKHLYTMSDEELQVRIAHKKKEHKQYLHQRQVRERHFKEQQLKKHINKRKEENDV